MAKPASPAFAAATVAAETSQPPRRMGRRERYQLEGPTEFSDAELLALLLGGGAGGHTALQIATVLLEQFGGLAGVAAREPQELHTVAGMGFARAVRIHAALEAGRRSAKRDLGSSPITSPDAAWAELEPGLRGAGHEELHALFLDRGHRVIARRCLTRGSDSYTVVDPRQIFRVALGVSAKGVILAHNHPSGDPTPSAQDVSVTKRVARAGDAIGIPLLDHLVIGGGRYHSLRESGPWCDWLPPAAYDPL